MTDKRRDIKRLLTRYREALELIAIESEKTWMTRVACRALNDEPSLSDCSVMTPVFQAFSDAPGDGRTILVCCKKTSGHDGKHTGEDP